VLAVQSHADNQPSRPVLWIRIQKNPKVSAKS
jgi:hypothetical protein